MAAEQASEEVPRGSGESEPVTERRQGTVPAWLVLFDCGHTRHPDACHCKGDDKGHAPHDGPPPPGWAGWCVECKDFRTTVECITADALREASDGR